MSTIPSKATLPRIANSATMTTQHLIDTSPPPFTNPFDNITTPLEDSYQLYDTPSHSNDPFSTDNNLVDTSIFDVPTPTANLCNTTSTVPTPTYQEILPNETSPFIDLLMDPTDYLHFSS